MAQRRASFHEMVLGPGGTQLGGDSLTGLSCTGDDAHLGEEQGPVLQIEPSAQLSIVEERAIPHHPLSRATLACESGLVALVETPGVLLEARGGGRERDLHEGGASRR